MKTIALYLVVGFCGIIFVTTDEQGDAVCNEKIFQSRCCISNSNHYNDTINKICSACFGRLCRRKCPRGYYGEQCDKTCTCDADLCNNVFGCINTTEKTSRSLDDKNTDEQQGKPLGMVLKVSLSASLFIIIVLLVVLLSVVYRARKNNTEYPIDSTERITSNVSSDNITRDSPVIYAAVVRPNRKPVRGLELSDQMYGNTLKLQKPNRGRKKKARKSKFNTSYNAMNEEGVKTGTPAIYSFVEHPNKTSLLDIRNPDRTPSLDVRHHGRTSSSDEGQYDQEYGNMTIC